MDLSLNSPAEKRAMEYQEQMHNHAMEMIELQPNTEYKIYEDFWKLGKMAELELRIEKIENHLGLFP